jgi:hypothetical protein
MLTRKAFLVQLAGGGWALSGCGGGDSGGAPAPAPSPQNTCSSTNITANHGHVLVIPRADLDSTTSRTYDIQGSSAHSHSVTFSATQLAQLKTGQPVTVTSSLNGHTHDVSGPCV